MALELTGTVPPEAIDSLSLEALREIMRTAKINGTGIATRKIDTQFYFRADALVFLPTAPAVQDAAGNVIVPERSGGLVVQVGRYLHRPLLGEKPLDSELLGFTADPRQAVDPVLDDDGISVLIEGRPAIPSHEQAKSIPLTATGDPVVLRTLGDAENFIKGLIYGMLKRFNPDYALAQDV